MTEQLIERAAAIGRRLADEIGKAVLGQDATVEQVLVAYFAGGHVLLEGVPGLAKTLLARALARGVDARYRRIQFTPDLMPSDITGTHIYNLATREFTLTRGPIFTDILLADEINRTPPKTQSALLEAMEEKQVSVAGELHPLGEDFFVIATQNPLEHEGTYPLPEAQLDRFLMKVRVDYPAAADEALIIKEHLRRPGVQDPAVLGLEPVVGAAERAQVRQAVAAVTVRPELIDYVVSLAARSRQSPALALGASPRAAIGWLQAARTRSALRGLAYVTPDDIKALAAPVLRHRLLLRPETEIEGQSVEEVIARLLAAVPVPQ